LESGQRRRVIHVHALQGLQTDELVVVLQHVFHPQIFAKQFGEGLFICLFFNGGRVGKACFQFLDHVQKATPSFAGRRIGKAFHVFLVALFQHHVLGVLVTEQGNGVDGGLLQVPKGNDIAEGLGGVKNTVGAGVGLNQPVEAQVFVHEQGVQGGGVKAGQEHAYHNQQIDFLGLNLLGQIPVIVLEAIAIHAEVGFEQGVVVPDSGAQKLLGAAVHGGNIKTLVLNVPNGLLFLVGRKGKDSGHPQGLVLTLL